MKGGGVTIAANGDASGGPARHVPVMLNEVVAALQPDSGSAFVDGTFGAGGYSQALLNHGCRILAIDRDPAVEPAGRAMMAANHGRFIFVRGRFAELDRIARDNGFAAPDGVVLDIGISSMHVDDAQRGFSFRQDGPLDMRMESAGPTASDVVNGAERRDLTRIFGLLGEERQAGKIAAVIERQRRVRPITRTSELASLIEQTVGRSPAARIHPATRCFQALRIFVNRELEQLVSALFAAERLLQEGGRLVVVCFHSLEDRIVKRFFADRSGSGAGSRHLPPEPDRNATFRLSSRGGIRASDAEIDRNPRARSAYLRWGTRTAVPAGSENRALFRLPDLPDPDGYVTGGKAR